MVTIEYECETDFDLGLDCPALAKIVAEKVLDMEKCPWDAQVNLVLTDNEEIKRVNTEFRGIERATDVLSFPMLPFETPADYSVAEDDESCFDLDSGELLLGDIMISAERAAALAERSAGTGTFVSIKDAFPPKISMPSSLADRPLPGRAAKSVTSGAVSCCSAA